MPIGKDRGLLGVATLAAVATIAAACAPARVGDVQNAASAGAAARPAAAVSAAGAAAQPASAPVAVAPQVVAPPGGFVAPAPGPNLLAKTWPERLGIVVSELRQPTGQAILKPKPGDLWFFTNSSTTWGATNTKNAVWVIDAKTKQTVAEASPADGEGASSHGITVSGDGRFVYLPSLGKDNHIDVLDGRTLEVVQTITTLGRPHHHKLWHDPNTGKDLIIGEDFNWSFSGSGLYAFDPSQNNAVVGGMSNGDFQGNPYVSTPAPDGSFIVVTVPAPTAALRDKMDGWVAKIDPKTWKVAGMTPMKDPLYATVSPDGKYAYVTSGGDARVYKVSMDTMKIEGEVQTGPGPWGATVSYDGTKIYVADKGEGPGYNQQGRTSTIIDLQTMGVTKAVPIGLTTDHALVSPDGKEIWYTSNAEHSIYVLDTATDEIKTVLKDPADGDVHGGVWVQYKDDGRGGVTGEVVADYGGLHGSALAARQQYLSEPAVTIAIGGTGFTQKALTVPAGKPMRVTVKNVGSTSAGQITFDAGALGIQPVKLGPGQSQELRWTVPATPGDLTAKTSKGPNNTLTLSVKDQASAPAAAAAAAATGPRSIAIHSAHIAWDASKVTVKAGETVRFAFTNGDDEKHNLVGLGDGLNLLSPDVPAGQTVSYEWTAPSAPGTFKVICAYHPQMTFDLVVQ